MISLFAFLIVLGMIVDDAIIVVENIYRHIELGKEPFIAAQVGASEVLWPVIISTLTTIAAFMPMFAISGILGIFIQVIPVVVCCALLGSLLEAFFVLPSHAGHLLHKRNTSTNWTFLLDHYCKLLKWCILNRYFVCLLSIAILAISVVYAATRLPFQLFGEVEIGQFFVNIETPTTYSIDDSFKVATELETAIQNVINEDELKTLLTNVGISFIDENRYVKGSHLIQIVVDLQKPVAQGFIEKWVSPLISLNFSSNGSRTRSSNQIIDAVRAEITKFSSVKRFSILKPDGGPAGADIEIGVIGNDMDIIISKANAIRNYLKGIPGIKDVRHDQDPGKLEYQYTLNENGKQLGLTQTQLSDAVRNGYLGNKVLYVTWNEKRIPVRMIYPQYLRQESNSLAELPIVLSNGKSVYLGDVADITIGHGLNRISRRDGQRMAKVTAEIDSSMITSNAVVAQIEKEFRSTEENSGYDLALLGEKKDAEEAFKGMNQALIISLAIIFFMLTFLFKSLLDPLVVMFAIPFGLIGVIIGHAIFSYNLQFLSVIGTLALSGIIVNDSLILVDFIKRMRTEGADRFAAVIAAGRVRARPILLTTITTFLGISPLIFFATGQTAFLSPMAVSLGFGLIFATILILLTLPCFYLIADDLSATLLRIVNRNTK